MEEEIEIKLCDFGFARKATSYINSYCGTPISMAPEILEKRRYNDKADIWSLGVLLYEMYTGSPPFKARSKRELKLSIYQGNYKVPLFKCEENI